MNIAPPSEPTPLKPLRLSPGVALAVLLLVFKFLVPIAAPDALIVSILGSVSCAVAILLWWLLLSRAPWSERLGAVLLIIVALFVTSRLLHASFGTGRVPILFLFLALPALGLAFVVWAITTRGLSDGLRRTTMAATILIAIGGWAGVRTGGVANDFTPDLHWRWTQTPEERLLAQATKEPVALPAAPATATPPPAKVAEVPKETPAAAVPEWPGFRGPRRDGIIPGVQIVTDWAASPPVELWRRAIGPGWSSYAVHGGLIYTQEQRGDDEVVSCYNAASGKPVWSHRDLTRFYESGSGAGPRSTPALQNGRVYAFGATGIVNALNANDGTVLWSRNASSDTGAKIPEYGFASSPLLAGDIVIVAASGRLIAYDAATGNPRWQARTGGGGYSSPHLFTIGGVTQVLLLTAHGATSLAPADGKLLWDYALPSGMRIVQPALASDGEILMSLGDSGMGGSGLRRLAVAQRPGGWTVQERWTSTGLKPKFNDFVVHNSHAYGFDGSILACIDLQDGRRKWKGGRYGGGQLVLLPDQNLLLVLSE
ncbi:MAG: PQQ-like beta-propeller repeat protein [Acidobacteria bacterium]|nr:PQQ-like beta-propeller repeat protein [Acidobacteriota bacterium]